MLHSRPFVNAASVDNTIAMFHYYDAIQVRPSSRKPDESCSVKHDRDMQVSTAIGKADTGSLNLRATEEVALEAALLR